MDIWLSPCYVAVKRYLVGVVRIGMPPVIPQNIATTRPRVLGVFLLLLLSIDADANAGEWVARCTAYMSPYALSLALWYQTQQRTLVATVWLLLRKPYNIFL